MNYVSSLAPARVVNGVAVPAQGAAWRSPAGSAAAAASWVDPYSRVYTASCPDPVTGLRASRPPAVLPASLLESYPSTSMATEGRAKLVGGPVRTVVGEVPDPPPAMIEAIRWTDALIQPGEHAGGHRGLGSSPFEHAAAFRARHYALARCGYGMVDWKYVSYADADGVRHRITQEDVAAIDAFMSLNDFGRAWLWAPRRHLVIDADSGHYKDSHLSAALLSVIEAALPRDAGLRMWAAGLLDDRMSRRALRSHPLVVTSVGTSARCHVLLGEHVSERMPPPLTAPLTGTDVYPVNDEFAIALGVSAVEGPGVEDAKFAGHRLLGYVSGRTGRRSLGMPSALDPTLTGADRKKGRNGCIKVSVP